jgi:tetratricopeptide (TPR) repeat protein
MNTGTNEERYVKVLLDAALARRERGQPHGAEVLLEEALELSRAEDRPRLVAAVLASQGVLERRLGNLESAAERLKEAIRLRRGINDALGIARALGDLAGVHLTAGDADEAHRCIEEALDVIAPLERGLTRAEVLEHAGRLHEKLGNPEKSNTCFAEAHEIYETLGDDIAVARVERLQAGDRRKLEDLPAKNLDEELENLERRRLLDALDAEGWNQSRAARRLGVTETRVRNLMRRHGLKPRNRRGRPRKVAQTRSV